jgi:hypothetical protein
MVIAPSLIVFVRLFIHDCCADPRSSHSHHHIQDMMSVRAGLEHISMGGFVHSVMIVVFPSPSSTDRHNVLLIVCVLPLRLLESVVRHIKQIEPEARTFTTLSIMG